MDESRELHAVMVKEFIENEKLFKNNAAWNIFTLEMYVSGFTSRGGRSIHAKKKLTKFLKDTIKNEYSYKVADMICHKNNKVSVLASWDPAILPLSNVLIRDWDHAIRDFVAENTNNTEEGAEKLALLKELQEEYFKTEHNLPPMNYMPYHLDE